MPETNQILMSHSELLELLIKRADVHEGVWALVLGWSMGTGNYGPTPDQTYPGVAVTLMNVGIQRMPAGPFPTIPGAVFLDAAKVNPLPGKSAKKK